MEDMNIHNELRISILKLLMASIENRDSGMIRTLSKMVKAFKIEDSIGEFIVE